MNLLNQAREVLRIEQEAISALVKRLGSEFEKAVEILYTCRSRVIIIGLGKSGLIGRKIAATFTSTGTPAIFLHAAEAAHGDLGVITKDDCVLAISKSGETEEIIKLLPLIKIIGAKLISFTGNLNSTLAKESDVALDISVEREACFLEIVPTASSIATLALGDALAMVLLKKRNFKKENFAFLHPGGNLGKHLFLKVEDVMYKKPDLPLVRENAMMKSALLKMSSPHNFGVVIVVDRKGKMSGIITDGDLRRMLKKYKNIFLKKIKEVMTKNPKIIDKHELAAKAVSVMEDYNITCLVIINQKREPIGLVRLHDLLKAGLVSSWQERKK
jgi:arabinose-5-phosphate isomerase